MATFQERYEEWKKKQNQQESGAASGGTASFQERFNAWRRENRGQQLYQDINRRLEQWSSSYNELAKVYTDRYAGRSEDIGTQAYVGDSGEWYDGFSAKQKKLSDQGRELLQLLERDRAVFGDEWTDSVKASILSGQTAYEDMGKLAEQDRDFWASFTPTEEQAAEGQTAEDLYGAWQTDYGFRAKYQGKNHQELEDIISNLQDGEERKWLEQYADSVKTADDYDAELAELDSRLVRLQEQYDRIYNGDVDPMALQVWHTDYVTSAPESRTDPEQDARNLELYNSLRGDFEQFGDVEKEIERLKSEKWRLENEKKYNFLKDNADFGEKSQVAHSEGISNYFDGLIQNADAHYDAVNNLYVRDPAEEVRDRNPILASVFDNLNQNLSYITESERATYNYLYNTQGQNAAEEYLDSLKYALADRHSQYTVEEWSKLTKDHTFAANVASVVTNLWSGIGYVDAQVRKIIQDIKEKKTGEYAGPINYNSTAMLPSKITSAIRGTTVQSITDKFGVIKLDEEKHPVLSRMLNGKGLADVYQLGMSLVDSAAVASMSPILGTAGTVLLSGSAATQTMLDCAASGANDEQALTMGFMAGAFEYLFEKYELESLLNNGSKSAVRALFNQSLSEGFGEGLTTVANLAADSLIMADKSELSRLAAEYMKKNPSWTEDKAQKEALKDLAIQVGWDAIGGMASGAVMGGGYAGANNAVDLMNTQRQQAAVGNTILNTEGGTDALRALALEMADGADGRAQRQLRKLAEQTVDGKQNATRVGKLYEAVLTAATGQTPRVAISDKTTNAISAPLSSYSSEKQEMIRSYLGAVDGKIKSFVQSVKNGDTTFKRERISAVSKRAATDIKAILGIDVSGYTNNINTNGVQHIVNRHGERGEHDTTMAVDDDVARVGWVLENYDYVEPLTENGNQLYSSEFRNSNNNPAPQIRFVKKIDGSYYVVEAVCENKYKKLWVQSAYLQKNEDVTQASAEGLATNHETNAQSALASPSSNNSIYESQASVNQEFFENTDAADQEGQLLADKTFRQGTNEVVQVHTFTDFANGKATVKLANGETAPAREISFAESDDNEVFHRTAAVENMTAPAANVIWQLWKNIKANKLPVSAKSFTSAAIATYKAGRFGDETILNDRDPRAAALTKDQRKLIYDTARRALQAETDAQQENVDKVYAEANKALQQEGTPRKGTYRAVAVDGLQVSEMNRQQRVAYEMANVVAQGARVDIELYNGGMEWGCYDHSKDTIRLNANAKWNQTTMMTFTLSHELAHRAKLGSPKKFKAFADFLVKEYGKQGTDLEALIGQQMNAAEEHDRWVPAEQRLNMTEEQAFEEVVADACQRMLLDTDAGQKLATFGAQSSTNRSILQDLKKWVTEFMDRIRRFFKNAESDSLAAKEFNRFDENTKQTLAKMFVDMTVDAGEKLSTIKEAGKTEKITTDWGGVRYAIKTERVIDLSSDNELSKRTAGMYGAQKYKEIQKYILEVLEGQPIVLSDGKKAVVDRSDALHIANKAGAEKTSQISEIKKLVETAVLYAKDLQVKHNKFDQFWYYRAEVRFKGQKFSLYVNVGRATNDRTYHIYDITKKIRDTADRTDGLERPMETKGDALESGIFNNSIRNTEQNVNNESADVAKMPHKLPVSRDVADREKLVDLFEPMVTNSSEYRVLENYRKHLDEMLAIEAQLDRLGAEIRRISFAEGPRDVEYLNKLKLLQKKAINRLNAYDNKLLGLEKSGVLKAMVERYRKQITQDSFDRAKSYYQERNERRENEIRQYYRESRRQAVERHDMAEIRQRIRKDVQRLDSLLNKGTKNKNVKAGMQEFVGAALRVAKGTFLKNYDEYDMIRNGIYNKLNREQREVFDRCRELLQELDMLWVKLNPDSIHDKWDPEERMRLEDRQEALKYELAKNMAVLRAAGVFQTENESLEESTARELIGELKAAYKALEDSQELHISGAYSEEVYDQIGRVEKMLAGKAIKDMTSIELKELQKLYRMISVAVSHSNELFGKRWKESVRERGEKILHQLQSAGKDVPAIVKAVEQFAWQLLTPDTVMEILGADALKEHIQEFFDSEDTYQSDLEHAKNYMQEQAEKYGRKNWKMDKQVDFAGTTITIGQAMSLYAYGRRPQAQDHLEGDGFVHSSNVRIHKHLTLGGIKTPAMIGYVKDPTQSYRVTREMYEDLEKILTKEQRQYVGAMQEYLSTVMAAKGNEVSMQLYGIELFGEKFYFPIKTAKEFSDVALGATKGEPKAKNAGFTQATQDEASNAIVLDDFENVWSGHVREMSNYHANTIAMENFDRVYNYHKMVEKNVINETGDTVETVMSDTNESVRLYVQRKVSGADRYLIEYTQNLNGGVRANADDGLGWVRKILGNFRKTRVLGSASVIVQQSAAFVRAMAHLGVQDLAQFKSWRKKYGYKPPEGLKKEMYKYCPVAGIKKMGGFDPSMGRTEKQYLLGEYNKETGWWNRATEWINNKLGLLPEGMDELTWMYIWFCAKNQTSRMHPELTVGSDAFCKEAAKLFSRIIRETQVYDSINAKPLIMQNKSVWIKSLTSFMNEPLKGLNQSIRAIARAMHGKTTVGHAVRECAVVWASELVAIALSCIFYAMRDDDEDETFGEKYLSAFTGKFIESILPVYKLPYVKDVISIFDGYNTNRSDTVLIGELKTGLATIFTESKATTPEEKEKEVWDELEKGYGYLLNFAGVPGSNLLREIRGIYYTVKRMCANSELPATAAGMRYAIMEGLPFTDKPTKTVQMENAVKENDAEHILRLLSTYKTESSAQTEFRKAVKEVYLRGDVSADDAMEFLQVYAGDDAEDAQKCLIEWEFKQKHTDVDLTDAQILDWTDYAEPAGISLDIYTRFVENIGTGSKKEDVVKVIDDLPISRKQKDALYLSRGYAESGLEDAPWN